METRTYTRDPIVDADIVPVPAYITGFEIDWVKVYSNSPQFTIHCIREWRHPPASEFIFDQHPDLPSIYYAEHRDGWVQFFSWNGTPDRGHGGAHFPIMLRSGKEITLIGPWSSRSGVMNKLGFGPCTEAVVRSHSIAVSVTNKLLKSLIRKFDPTRELARVQYGDDLSQEWHYEPLTRAGFPKFLTTSKDELL